MCANSGSYTHGSKVYSTKGLIRQCNQVEIDSTRDDGCDGQCNDFHYSWTEGEGSCVPGKSSGDITLDWMQNSFPASNICWRPKCTQPNTYWVMKLPKTGADAAYINNPANYEGCEECKFKIVSIITTDPTQYSYVITDYKRF
jgi:hypothetical protein